MNGACRSQRNAQRKRGAIPVSSFRGIDPETLKDKGRSASRQALLGRGKTRARLFYLSGAANPSASNLDGPLRFWRWGRFFWITVVQGRRLTSLTKWNSLTNSLWFSNTASSAILRHRAKLHRRLIP
jgi:hypothetical protein